LKFARKTFSSEKYTKIFNHQQAREIAHVGMENIILLTEIREYSELYNDRSHVRVGEIHSFAK